MFYHQIYLPIRKVTTSLFEIVSFSFLFIFIFDHINLFLYELLCVFIKESQGLSYLLVYLKDKRGHFKAILDDDGISIIWISRSDLYKFGWQELELLVYGKDKKWWKAFCWSCKIVLSVRIMEEKPFTFYFLDSHLSCFL